MKDKHNILLFLLLSMVSPVEMETFSPKKQEVNDVEEVTGCSNWKRNDIGYRVGDVPLLVDFNLSCCSLEFQINKWKRTQHAQAHPCYPSRQQRKYWWETTAPQNGEIFTNNIEIYMSTFCGLNWTWLNSLISDKTHRMCAKHNHDFNHFWLLYEFALIQAHV